MSLRDRLRRLLDAEAKVEPLTRPRLTDGLDPLAGSPTSQIVEDEVRRLDASGQTEADELTREDGES